MSEKKPKNHGEGHDHENDDLEDSRFSTTDTSGGGGTKNPPPPKPGTE